MPAGEYLFMINGAASCVEVLGSAESPAVLLIGASMLSWPDALCERLVAGGRRVIRYDVRDTGRSESYPPGLPGYSLADLVNDAVGVLDATSTGAAHVAGLATGGWIIARHGWLRAAGVLIFGFGFWALLLTFSRAAWGGLVVGGLSVVPFLRLYLRRLDTRISLAAATAAALVVGLAFVLGYQPLLAARAGEGQESVELRSVSDRLVFMDFAFRSIRERPILGVGIGNFPWRTSYYLVETNFDLRGDNVHNVLLSVTAELGVVGLVLVLAAIGCGAVVVVAGLRASVWQSQTVRGDAHPARLALFAVFAALLAVGFLDHYPWTQIHFQAAWWGCLAAAFPRELSTA